MGPGGVVGGLPIPKKGQGPLGIGLRPRGKRAIKETIGVAKSLLGMSRSGYIRKFLFSLAGPVLKNLKSVGSKAAYNSMARYIIPFTGPQ